jgi:hypothetical protein
MIMKRKVASTVAGVSTALCLVGFSAANAAAAPAHQPAWHIIYTRAQNAEFEAVVATGKTSGFAFLEPNETVATPVAYERTGATTFKKVPFPTVADEWVAGASASSPSDVYVFADILTLSSSKAESEVLKWTGKRFSVVATFTGELGGGTGSPAGVAHHLHAGAERGIRGGRRDRQGQRVRVLGAERDGGHTGCL